MQNAKSVCSWALLLVLAGGCSGVPESVKLYAADLPARADGQYALLEDDDVRKQLVLKDAELQCKIDTADDMPEEKSAACGCAKSAGDWRADCKGWLGNHTPAPPAPPAPNASAAPPPRTDAPNG